MKKFLTKRTGAISFLVISIVFLIGIVTINYQILAKENTKTTETVAAIEESSNISSQEMATEVNEEVTPEEEAEYEEYLDKEEKKEEKKVEEVNLPYYIKVNYQAQTVTVYSKDANGEYTVPVTAFICSTGTDTPKSGVYPLKAKYRWVNLKGDVYGQYSSRIVGSILFHSVYYYEKFNPGTLCYTGFDKLGRKASAGCVRLNVASAKWIYDNCPVGTKVEFYASSNPGPLGKPASQKISSNEACRGWDPTDPDPANPWRTYVEPTVQPEVTPVPEPVPTPTPVPTPEPEANISITNVTLSKTKLELEEGEKEKLEVTILPDNADIESIEWKSSDTKVATVTTEGKIEAVSKGTATITLTVKDKNGNIVSKTCEITVKEKVIDNTIINELDDTTTKL